ncbi:hypothetical protein CYMTET_20577 [Cymbomonas tetramitiformis]|uniref:Uncharacterized protein n=1 Tax=Cymbomonas tetramitiformis TaxID=36881 RepID=A0AAE0L3U5_9CHLO|nr:hypothetical protein CYMTET_20577 [Cymbomonas tetramitiformis]
MGHPPAMRNAIRLIVCGEVGGDGEGGAMAVVGVVMACGGGDGDGGAQRWWWRGDGDGGGATVMEVEAMVVEVKGVEGGMAMEVVEMVVVGGEVAMMGVVAMAVVEMVVGGGRGRGCLWRERRMEVAMEMVGAAMAMEEEVKSVEGGEVGGGGAMEVEVDCSLKMKKYDVEEISGHVLYSR